MTAYYNEIDPFAAAWLRELIRDGVIPGGEVDERSVVDVQPDDLRGFAQCHFFAGIGGWAYALRLAGVPDSANVWTGSCPCQPFSAAGKGEGFADSRHLWPTWFRLIRECRPPALFGEQVASADGRGWFDTVSTDLEEAGYAVGAANLCAAGAGAPHIRQRLYFAGVRLADSGSERRQQERWSSLGDEGAHGRRADCDHVAASDGENGGLADAAEPRGRRRGVHRSREGNKAVGERPAAQPERSGVALRIGDTGSAGSQGRNGPADLELLRGSGEVRPARETGSLDGMEHSSSDGRIEGRAESERGSVTSGCGEGGMDDAEEYRTSDDRKARQSDAQRAGDNFWSDCIWLPCTDGKLRPAKPGILPLASRFSDALDALCSIEEMAANEVRNYGSACETDPNEALRMVRQSVHQAASREGSAVGVRDELHEAEVLLPFLFCVETALSSGDDAGSIAEAREQVRRGILRSMRDGEGARRPSRQRRPDAERAIEPSNSLHRLSLVLARHAEAHRQKTIIAYAASCRVGMLKGAGNSIVPQVAAAFIQATGYGGVNHER